MNASPADPIPAPKKSQHPLHNPQLESNIKETIESILVAFILAFIFRAFVVEAFVIPTGSMAPTLMGAHMRFTCDDCGYQFDVNYNATGNGDDLNIPSNAGANSDRRIVCPNCGYVLPKADPHDQAYNPLVRFGDRILVLKYLYLLHDPKRWDVVVFKSPDRPELYDYTQNYIKRLVGRPNEAIMVLDGDIYAGSHDARAEDLIVQTKPYDVQQRLWRIVHDSDFESRGLSRSSLPAAPYADPWLRRSGQTGWQIPGDANTPKRSFKFANDTASAEIFFNNQANVQSAHPSAFNDWLAYDVEVGEPPGRWSEVGDLKLQFYYQRKAGDGTLRLAMSKRGQDFIAEIGPHTARLLTDDDQTPSLVLIGDTAFTSQTSPMQIEFINVDYQVTLRIDGKIVLQTTPAEYRPNISRLLESRNSTSPPPQVRISADRQHAELTHLSLWRDIYYLNHGDYPVRRNGVLVNEPYRGSPDNIMRLNADEYFTMGDNSQISGDGRYWSEPTDLPFEGLSVDPGKVPARFLLGKAFFVYWPAGYRPFESPAIPAIAPDFGDMRFIH